MSDFIAGAGFVPLEQFAKDVGKDVRTIYRWLDQVDGLPFCQLGGQKLIPIDSARAWLLARVQQRNPSRPRRRRR